MKYATSGDGVELPLGGRRYIFRAPTLYDVPRMRWRLTRAGVRRPTIEEYEQASIAGIRAMMALTGDNEAGETQLDIIERWYPLLPEPKEDDIDEVDEDRRLAILAQKRTDRASEMAQLYPSVLAIEANLDRHWSDWRELRADMAMWKDVSLIDAARLLLVAIDGSPLPRAGQGDDKDLVTQAAFMAIADPVRARLGQHALEMLAPTEAERKN